MDPSGIPALQEAISHMHGLRSEWVESVPVTETFQGETVWDGEVHVFSVEHPKASRCYAWSHESGPDGRRKFFAVLGVSPVKDAQTAVQASIAAS